MYVDIYNLSEERGVTFDVARIRMQGVGWLEYLPHGDGEWTTLAEWDEVHDYWRVPQRLTPVAWIGHCTDFDVDVKPSGLFPVVRLEVE